MPKRAAVQSSKHPQDWRQPRQFGSGVGKVGSKNADSIINRPSAGLASQASVSPRYAVCALRSLPLILTAELCFYTSISETWNGEFASIALMKNLQEISWEQRIEHEPEESQGALFAI
jgi:hypothetical protein